MAETPTTITLWRPVGRNELALIRDAESRRFPPRLDGQPIFYPVRNFEYAEQIARDWNSTDRRHAYVGYVTEFQVREDFLRRYEPHQVGARMHSEYWIPADELDLFNDAIIGPIEVVAEYRHGRRIEPAPGESLPLDEARIDEIRESYRRLADEWGQAHGDPAVANELFRQHHAVYKTIRERDEGQVAIASLMDDPSTPVRLLAATHSLAWSKDRAVEVLREIELADGCMSIDAKYTLNSFSEGKLDLDW